MKKIYIINLAKLSALFLGILLVGCASDFSQVLPANVLNKGMVKRAQMDRVKKGMTSEEVLSICQEPFTIQKPSKKQVHRMFPGHEWEIQWTYHGEALKDRYIKKSFHIYFNNGQVVYWEFPFITKTQYWEMEKRVNAGEIRTEAEVVSIWGNPATYARAANHNGAIVNYNLLQLDGTIYNDAIEILYYPNMDSIWKINLANF